MPGLYITAKELATGAVTFNKPKYDQVTGKVREALAFFTFGGSTNVLTSAPHALGRVPTAFSVVTIGRNGGSPGVVYADDLPLAADKFNIALKCTSTNTFAVVSVR
jgi:hypothetical protein